MAKNKYACIRLMCLLSIFIFCVPDLFNPYDPEYIGDYQLMVKWDKFGKLATNGVFNVLTPYEIEFSNNGKDSFLRYFAFVKDSSVSAQFDTLAFCISESGKAFIYFDSLYTGGNRKQIVIRGVKPNLKPVDSISKGSFVVENPFEIEMKSNKCILQPCTLKVKKPLLFQTQPFDTLKAQWILTKDTADSSDILKDTLLPAFQGFIWKPQSKMKVTLNCNLQSTFLNSLIPQKKKSFSLKPFSFSVIATKPQITSATVVGTQNLGDTLMVAVAYNDTDKSPTHLFLYSVNKDLTKIFLGDSMCSYSENLYVRSRFPINNPAMDSLLVVANADCGSSDTEGVKITINPDLPSPLFAEDNIIVPMNISYPINVYESCSQKNGVLYTWKTAKKFLDTTTNVPMVALLYNDTLKDTIYIHATKFGIAGGYDTVRVHAKNVMHWIVKDTFPTTIVVNRPTRYKVHVRNASNSDIVDPISFRWSVFPKASIAQFDTLGNTAVLRAKDSLTPCTVSVYAIIKDSDTTPKYFEPVGIAYFKPWARLHNKKYRIKTEQVFRCTVTCADSPERRSIKSIYWKCNTDSVSVGTDSVWNKTFTTPGVCTLRVWVEDNEGFFSDTQKAVLDIYLPKPIIKNLEYNPAIIYKDRETIFRLVTDTSGIEHKVSQWMWSFQVGQWKMDTTTKTDFCKFSIKDSGTVYLSGQCMEDSTLVTSPIFHDTFYCDPGKPRITGFVIKSEKKDSLYINDSCTVEVQAQDFNGKNLEFKFTIDTMPGVVLKQPCDSFGNAQAALPIRFQADKCGIHKLRVVVTDGDSMSSIKDSTFIVALGKPVIKDVKSDSSIVYIRDTICFTLQSFDNDKIEYFKVNWGEDTNFEIYKTNDNRIKKLFTTAGTKNIRLLAVDNDTLVSDTFRKTITIRLGKPVVTATWINKINEKKTIFAKDTNRYFTNAIDTNGSIRMFYWKFSSSSKIDSVPAGDPATCDTAFIVQSFVVRDSGAVKMKSWVKDDDNLTSDTLTTTIFVNPGRPFLWADATDTIWVIIDKNAGDYDINVHATDSNGTIKKYYWNLNKPVNDNDTLNPFMITDSAKMRFPFSLTTINAGFPIYIAAFDNDNLMGRMRCIVFADSVPRKPHSVNPLFNATMDTVTLRWENEDKKDSLTTEFKIQMDYKVDVPVSIIKDFYIAQKFNGGYYTLKYRIPQRGRYSWRVIARDKRNSIVMGDIDTFDTTPVENPTALRRSGF